MTRYGWRTWVVCDDHEAPYTSRLRSLSMEYEWPRYPVPAVHLLDCNCEDCQRIMNGSTPHASPVDICQCGFYSLNSYQRLFVYGPALGRYHTAFGAVEIWGRNQRHVYGQRSEYAKPVILFADVEAETANALAAYYDCVVKPNGSAMGLESADMKVVLENLGMHDLARTVFI